MTKLKKKIKQAIRKGHNRILIYNQGANCLNLLNVNSPLSLSDRLSLNESQFFRETWEVIGVTYSSVMSCEQVQNCNEFVSSWRDL